MEENLKQSWQNTRFSSEENPDRMRDIMDGRRRTALENLAVRYRQFSTIGFVMGCASCFWYQNPLFGESAPWVATAMVAFFLLCGVIDSRFCRGIRSIDVASMPIAEVAAKALHYRKRHLQAIALLLPLAIGLIGLIVYASTGDRFFLAGVAVGGAAGLVVGLTQLRKFMNDYRSLSEQ